MTAEGKPAPEELRTKLEEVRRGFEGPDCRIGVAFLSDPEYLPVIREFISGMVRAAFGDERTAYMVAHAVDEAVANIIKHGYKGDTTKRIELEVFANPAAVRIRLRDQAPPFDPKLLERRWNLDEYRKEVRVGGLGLFMILELMDEVKYNRDSAGRNVLTMVKKYGAG